MRELVKLFKLTVCFRSYASMVHISVFIRPQTNRIQGHQIINSTKFPPTPLKCTPLIFPPFCQKQTYRFKSDYCAYKMQLHAARVGRVYATT